MKKLIKIVDSILPEPMIEDQMRSWEESKKDNFLNTLKSYLKREFSPQNLVNAVHEIRKDFRGKKVWLLSESFCRKGSSYKKY